MLKMSELIIVLVSLLAVSSGFEKWEMDRLCSQIVPVHGGELHFDSDELPLSTELCSLTLQAEVPEDKLSIFFTTLSVGMDCNHTNISFVDGHSETPDSAIWPGLKAAVCSDDPYMNEQQIFTTSGPSLTIRFHRNIDREEGRTRSNFTMKVSSFKSQSVPCDTSDRGNETLYLCKNRRCVYKDLLCHHLNPCGDFYDFCPDTSVQPEEGSVPIMVPVLIIVSTMIVLFFLCQGFLMIRNRKCPCRHHGYSNELERQTSNASSAISQNGEIRNKQESERFFIA